MCGEVGLPKGRFGHLTKINESAPKNCSGHILKLRSPQCSPNGGAQSLNFFNDVQLNFPNFEASCSHAS